MTVLGNIGLRVLAALALSAACMGPAFAAEIRSSVVAADLLEEKLTSEGLYLSSSDAAAALEADPGIVFLDVRDPSEINFVGHPTPIDAIVPVEFATLEFDAKKGAYKMVLNSDFVAQVNAIVARENADKDSPVLVMCRSGGRSAAAVEVLAKAGYTNVWTLVEGFEGDKDTAGVRSTNGWRNAGLPWTYKLTADQAWMPKEDAPN